MSTENNNPPAAPPTATLLTPLAPGGVAVLRVFGHSWPVLLDRLFRPADAGRQIQPNQLRLGQLIDPADGEPIDQAIIHVLPGRLGVELNLHGGVRIVQRAMAACESLGAHRLDWRRTDDRAALWGQARQLALARGVPHPALWADVELALSAARTQRSADWLLAQHARLAEATAELIARGRGGRAIAEDLRRLLDESAGWSRLLTTPRVAIVGPANAGKSTLLNVLAGREAAIVSDAPGATRDYVTHTLDLAGLAVEMIDTAGLRALPAGPLGRLEYEAGELAGPIVTSAQLRLILLDATAWPPEPAGRLVELSRHGPALWAINKCDVGAGMAGSAGGEGAGPQRRLQEWLAGQGLPAAAPISARTGQGVESLIEAIRDALGVPPLSPARAGLFCPRQRDVVATALSAGPPERQADSLAALLE